MKNVVLSAIFMAIGASLAGCAGDSGERASRPEYQQGYGDGCATGSGRTRDLPGPVIRDAHLFDTNEAYSAGWRAGFNSCNPLPSDPFGR